MVTKDQIDSFIQRIPPTPKVLKNTLMLLREGELVKAAKEAEGDLALKSYLKSIVNKPIYGFKNEVSDISQIFGILGVSLSQQSVYNYMMTLLSPDKWALFKLNASLFSELQAELSKEWENILKHLGIEDKEIYAAITLLPSSIIVAEALFSQSVDDVHLLRSVKALDYNTILRKLCGMDLFDICEKIAEKWDMEDSTKQIIQASSGIKPQDDKKIDMLGKWMHLLLFYKLSKPAFIEAGLNDFIDFQVDYVSDIYEDFASLMDIQ